MTDHEIADLETLIKKQCEVIISRQRGQESELIKRQATIHKQVKVQPLTMLQRKELERQLSLDYYSFPVQPCVRSLYYISKIAQT